MGEYGLHQLDIKYPDVLVKWNWIRDFLNRVLDEL